MNRRGPSDRLGVPNRWRSAAARRLGVDARALAALRISLGALLLADLGIRAADLRAFYTDAGVLPRSALAESFPAFARLSLHAASGEAWFQALLFVVAGAFALALALGFRTRLAAFVSLLLLVSLHARNPLVLNAGDSLLRRLLFWGLFLPLGARWSVDAVARGPPGDEPGASRDRQRGPWIAGVATAALLLQVVVVYTANAAFKLRGERWVAGDAIRYVFGLDHLTVFLGDALARYPDVLVLFDRLWLAMILGSVLLVVLTGRARTAFVGALALAHLGMAATLRLGLFPLVSIAALLAFLPPSVWDATESRLSDAVAAGERLGRGLTRPSGAGPSIPGVPVPNRVRRGWSQTVPFVVAALLLTVLVWNAATLGVVATPAPIESAVDPGQYRWDMFAPEPRAVDGWYVVPAELPSGERVDAFHDGAVEWDPPPEAAATFPSHRWFVYLLDLRAPANADLRPYFGEYLCGRWNRAHGDDLVALSVYYVERPVRLDGPEPTRRVLLHEQACPAA